MPAETEVLIPHFSRRFSGVTASVIALIPALEKHYPTFAVGYGIPKRIPRVSWLQLWTKLRSRSPKIWQARRNNEMLLGLFFKKILRYPLTLIWLTADNYRRGWLTRFLYRRMDAVIATSESAASFIDRPSTVVPHGIDTQRFRPSDNRGQRWREKGLGGEYGIAILGRVRPNKGTGDFVEALCEILPSFPNWTGVLIGETTPRYRNFQQELQRKIERAGLAGRVIFVGKVENFDEIPDWYRAVSLVVAPPWLEGFGLTVPEAMASACAVVATDTGAFPQIIESGENGWLIPRRDAAALKSALRHAMTRVEQLDEIGLKGRRRIEEHFSAEREAESLAKIYRGFVKVP